MRLITNKEYGELVSNQDVVRKLEAEIERLGELITSQTKDCKMGPWCKDCAHYGQDWSDIQVWNGSFMLCDSYNKRFGIVGYCKKHLHELCKEFEAKPKG